MTTKAACWADSKRRPAMALLAVMVIILLVALAAYGFNQRMTDAYRLSQLRIERAQARLAARGGLELLLLQAEQSRVVRSGGLCAAEQVRGIDLAGAVEAETSEWRFSVVSPIGTAGTNAGTNAVGRGLSDGESQGEGWKFGAANESAKINLYALHQWDKLQPGHAKQALLRLPGAEASVVDTFLRVYQIGSPQSNGSSGIDRIKGAIEQANAASAGGTSAARRWATLWCGGDWDCNYRVDELEAAILNGGRDLAESSTTTGQEVLIGVPAAWREYLTFYSGQRNENRQGRPRIFLNDSDLQKLQRQLLEVWPVELANYVIAVRQFGFDQGSGGGAVISSANWAPDLTKPAGTMIRNALDLVGSRVRIPAVEGEEKLISSPFVADGELASDYLEKLIDDVTTNPNPVIVGQIDIQTAPYEVLSAVPAITPTVAEAIVQQRGEGQSNQSHRETIAWLLSSKLVDLPTLKQLAPWITVGGDCYSAQVIGWRDSQSAVYRCTAVIDGRVIPARLRDVRLWHAWGRGFDVQILGSHETESSLP